MNAHAAVIRYSEEPALTKESIYKKDGSHAKPYQVRQVRYILLRYRLGGDE